ncbi:VanZ family protein [Rhodococcus sp. NPDC127528]|uniref:VanZ family protein n=1 Tax=unclassified Rhodococcus (in: high G+C Gram-positive bacteria) TaxID=192944 RepID=UPI00364003D1
MPRLRWLPLGVVFAVTLVLLFSPGSAVPGGPPNSDKVTHPLMFAALAFSARYARVAPRTAAAVAVAYAGLSEVLQAVLPIQRSGSVWDWAADVAGVVVGLVAFAAWQGGLRRRGRGDRDVGR